MSGYRKVGLSLTSGQVQRLDDIKADWDDREVTSVSRSEVARDALELGLAVLETTDDKPAFRRLHMREQRGVVVQALESEFRSDRW